MTLFTKPEDLEGYLFRILDNGGATADRYTVVFSDGTFLNLSGSPTHPQGVSLSGDGMDPAVLREMVESGEAVDLALGDLPAHIVQHVIDRNNNGFQDFLEAIERCDPDCVAWDRETAEVNEGMHSDVGVGIYMTDGVYYVRLDGDAQNDRGPVASARQALLLSLPDENSLAGPEYHSTEDVMRLKPSPEVVRKIEELENKVASQHPAP